MNNLVILFLIFYVLTRHRFSKIYSQKLIYTTHPQIGGKCLQILNHQLLCCCVFLFLFPYPSNLKKTFKISNTIFYLLLVISLKILSKMRRSAAPSRKVNSNQNSVKSINNVIASTQSSKNTKNIIKPSIQDKEGVRCASTILNILQKPISSPTKNVMSNPSSSINNPENNEIELKENIPGKENSTDPTKKIYNVVWGKKTTKKHKTWEGDGVLEVGIKTGILKDTDGNIMGRATIKPELIEEGFILS